MFDVSRSDLAGVPQATLRQWLLDAQTALHQLAIGGKVEAAAYTQGDGSKSVTYTRAQLPQLRAHIALLQSALGIRGVRRPLRPRF